MAIKEERKKRVIDLYYNQGKTTREIANIERMSIRDISTILKEEEARRQKHKQQEISSKAYKLFSEGKRPVEVAIVLSLREPEITKMYSEHWRLRGLYKLNSIYKEMNGKLGPFLKLYRQLIKGRVMTIDQIVNVVEIAIHKLPYMESLYEQAKDQAEKMQQTVQRLANDIRALELKISTLDKTALSCELECKRTEQRVQELAIRKDRLEKLIAHVLNGGGYTKLKQIVKENVKAAVSQNTELIPIAFAAIIQTLKDDPQMANLIYNIHTSNNGEQRKDNDNNITKYLEANKDSLVDLAEKNYENLVEELTKNAINTTASSPSNPASSLPHSSSTFPNSFDQIDIYRKEESESFDNSKGDIVG